MNQQNKTERWVEKLNEMGFNHPPLHQFIRNLLLETKKKKKCTCPNRNSDPMIVDPTCSKHKKSKYSLPNEKEILGMLDGLTIIVRK